MGHFQAATPKRHYAYSNAKTILKVDKGRLQGWKPSNGKKVITAEHYKDKSGKSRYKGTPQLKGTENLVLHYMLNVVFVSRLHQHTSSYSMCTLVHLKLLAAWFPVVGSLPHVKLFWIMIWTCICFICYKCCWISHPAKQSKDLSGTICPRILRHGGGDEKWLQRTTFVASKRSTGTELIWSVGASWPHPLATSWFSWDVQLFEA